MSIVEELLQKESALCGNQFGMIIFHKFTLSLFRHQKVDWKAMQEKEGKKRKLFSGLVGKSTFYSFSCLREYGTNNNVGLNNFCSDQASGGSDVKRSKKEKKSKKQRQSSESTW